MSVLNKLVNRINPSSEIYSLLEKTNDYTIYCFFIGKELKFKEFIKSPLREDTNPTFNIFPAKVPRWDGQILFKDFNGDTGNVFKFIEKYTFYHYNKTFNSIHEVIEFIETSMGLNGDNPIEIKKLDTTVQAGTQFGEFRLKHEPRWKKIHIDYWAQYGVSKELAEIYKIVPVRYLLNKYDKIIMDFNQTSTFAYWISDRFKLYQPYEENFKKFFNQCPKNYLQGIEQCTGKGYRLVVTKSLKDVVVFQAHTPVWEDIIAPHGEGYIMDEAQLYWMLKTYNRIDILFDPDYAGVAGSNRLRKQLLNSRFYTNQEINVDFISHHRIMKRGKLIAPIKDISDFRLITNKQKTEEKIKSLFNGK